MTPSDHFGNEAEIDLELDAPASADEERLDGEQRYETDGEEEKPVETVPDRLSSLRAEIATPLDQVEPDAGRDTALAHVESESPARREPETAMGINEHDTLNLLAEEDHNSGLIENEVRSLASHGRVKKGQLNKFAELAQPHALLETYLDT